MGKKNRRFNILDRLGEAFIWLIIVICIGIMVPLCTSCAMWKTGKFSALTSSYQMVDGLAKSGNRAFESACFNVAQACHVAGDMECEGLAKCQEHRRAFNGIINDILSSVFKAMDALKNGDKDKVEKLYAEVEKKIGELRKLMAELGILK